MFWKRKFANTSSNIDEPFKTRVQDFWKWYAAKSNDFLHAIESDNCADLQPEVTDAVRKLGLGAWVFGPGPEEKGGHSFTITGEGNIHKQFLTEYWVKKAPEIDGWTFYPSRQPGELNPTQGIEIMECHYTFAEVWITPQLNENDKIIDLIAWHPHFDKLTENDRYMVIFLLLDEVLGEYGTTNWIGKIDLGALKQNEAIPICELRDFVLDLEIQRSWKKYPPTQTFASYRIPEQTRSFQRSDVYVGMSANFGLIGDFMSNHGNLKNPVEGTGAGFIYVSFDSNNLPKGSEVEYRAQYEDAIEALLQKESCGQVIGGAMGQINAYIDLIYFDQNECIQLTTEALKAQGLPAGSMIHSFTQDFPPITLD